MSAKRHHYVPQFLLRQFSCNSTVKRAPLIWCMEKATGRLFKPNINNVAVVQHHNRLESVPPELVSKAEELAADIDAEGGAILPKLLGGQKLTPKVRTAFALFLLYQFYRTPLGRE